jgi:hypothetical protein
LRSSSICSACCRRFALPPLRFRVCAIESTRDQKLEAVKERRAALEALLRIADRRARLLGMDAPIKVEQTVTEIEPEDLELAKMIEEAKAGQ